MFDHDGEKKKMMRTYFAPQRLKLDRQEIFWWAFNQSKDSIFLIQIRVFFFIWKMRFENKILFWKEILELRKYI